MMAKQIMLFSSMILATMTLADTCALQPIASCFSITAFSGTVGQCRYSIFDTASTAYESGWVAVLNSRWYSRMSVMSSSRRGLF